MIYKLRNCTHVFFKSRFVKMNTLFRIYVLSRKNYLTLIKIRKINKIGKHLNRLKYKYNRINIVKCASNTETGRNYD